jgi:hypothetical protein
MLLPVDMLGLRALGMFCEMKGYVANALSLTSVHSLKAVGGNEVYFERHRLRFGFSGHDKRKISRSTIMSGTVTSQPLPISMI